VIHSPEARPLVLLPAEDAGQHVPANPQPLLEKGSHLGLLLLRLPGDAITKATDAAHGEDDGGQNNHRQRGQPPVEQEDGDQGEDDDGDVLGDAGQSAGDDVLHAGHVVVDPAHDLAGLGDGVEAQRLLLEVREQLKAQVGHDRLADQVIEVLLQHAD